MLILAFKHWIWLLQLYFREKMISTVLKLIRLIPAWLQFSDVYILGIVTLMIFTGLKKQIIVCWIRNFRTAQGENQQSTKRNNLSTTRYSFNHVSFYRKKSSKPKNSLLYNQHFQKEIAFLFLISENRSISNL